MRNPDCTRCILHKTTHYVCVPGEGAQGGIMLVGEAPGADEERLGRPFVGQAGRLLEEALSAAGMLRQDVFITNSVRCRPPSNRTPDATEAAACLPYLLEEIEEVKPALIVCMGNAALATLTGLKAVTAARGRVLAPKKGLRIDVPIRAMLHPAAALYDRNKNLPTIIDDLTSFAAIVAGTKESPRARSTLIVTPRNLDDARIIPTLEKLTRSAFVACDLEWTYGTEKGDMILPWRDLGDGRRGEVFSLAIAGEVGEEKCGIALPWPLPQPIRDWVEHVLTTRPTIFHNAMSDMLWLWHNKIRPKLGGDTMLLAHLLDPAQRGRKLEELVLRYIDSGAWWKAEAGRFYRDRPDDTDDATWEELLQYNAQDAENTLALHQAEVAEAKRVGRGQAIGRLYSRIVLPALPILLDAWARGVPLDESLLDTEIAKAKERGKQAAEELSLITSLPPQRAAAMATSTQQTVEYLKHAYGLEIDSSGKDELSNYTQYPAVGAITAIRKEQKSLSTYLTPWKRLLGRQGGDGRLHTMYKLSGTETARLSAEVELGGSLQVTPRNDDRINFRDLIRADPGRLMLSFDLSQVELRVGAWIANEPTMQAIYDRDRGLPPGVIKSDLHLRTAMEVNRNETVQTAKLLLMRYGLPPDGTGAEILRTMWKEAGDRYQPTEVLRLCCAYKNTPAGDWFGWRAKWTEQQQLEGRRGNIQEVPEEFLRAVWEHPLLSSASSRSQSDAQRPIEYQDSLQILSREGAQLTREFPEWKQHRQRAKAINFGYLFGMMPDKFITTARVQYGIIVTYDESVAFRSAYMTAYPRLPFWHDEARSSVAQLGGCSTPFGRWRNFNDPAEYNAAINTPVQSSASDFTLLGMIATNDAYRREGLDAWIIGQVHDSILVDVSERDAEKAKELGLYYFENIDTSAFGFTMPIPIKAEAKLGVTWG